MIQDTVAKMAGKQGRPPGQQAFMDRACDIIIAFLNNNSVAPGEVPGLIASVHATLSRLYGPGAGGAVDIHATVTPDYIVCLEDGKRLQTLKRYLGGRFGLTPEQYRQKWNLPSDYPMVAPNYAKRRSQIAKKMGLGHKRGKKRRKGL